MTRSFRREDYIAPGGVAPARCRCCRRARKSRPLRRSRPKKAAQPSRLSAKNNRPRHQAGPRSLGLAAASARPSQAEPTPQKPDIKLPTDAIRAGRAGSKPLSEHLRKHEEKKAKDEAAAKRAGPRKPAPAGEEAAATASRRAGRGPRAAASRWTRRRRAGRRRN